MYSINKKEKTLMSNIFNTALFGKQPHSKYHIKHESKSSFNFGEIVPILCKNVYPGDTWSIALSSFLRTQSLMSPVMHRNDIKIDAFYVPMRLIWKSSPLFYQCDESVKVPKVYVGSDFYTEAYDKLFGNGGLYDYFNFGSPDRDALALVNAILEDEGLDTIKITEIKKNALPLRAYFLIYDYYFRNKTIEDPITDSYPDFYGDNDNVIGNSEYDVALKLRPWRRDIFTSALPDPQNGADVLIPQPDLDSIIESDGALTLDALGNLPSTDVPSHTVLVDGNSVNNRYNLEKSSGNATGYPQKYETGLKSKIDVSNSPTMRQLRYANQLGEYEEAMARAGFSNGESDSSKFKEWLRAIWGVKSSDARLDRPEYLGGYRGPITISEIPQTSASTENSPQGNLAGKGVSAGGRRLFRKMYFEEPGIIMVTCSVVPKSSYCQGDPREWLIESGFDIPNPYFDRLGEQDVKMDEINCLSSLIIKKGVDMDSTFGYNIRNYFAKDFPDEIHGDFRGNLAFWHEGRMFDYDQFPVLNLDFLKVHPDDANRIFPSTETSDKLLGQFFFDTVLHRRFSYSGLPRFSSMS